MTLESKERLRNAVHSRLVRQKKSAKEIQETLESLRARPLSYDEYKAMPQDVASWHEFANSLNVDKALQAHQDEQKKAAEKAESHLRLKWESEATAEDRAKASEAAEEFLSRYRHVIRDSANSCAIADRMKLKNRNPQDVNSFIRTFEELAVEGLVFLNGKVAGICDEEMVGGHALRTHPQLHRFLKPTPTAEQLEQLAAAKMSADEWKRSRPELQDGLPFLIQQQFFKAAHSLASFEPEYVFSDENNAQLIEYVNKNRLQFNLTGLRTAFNAIKDQLELKPITVQGQVTQLTDYDPRETGEPEAPGKLRAKVRNMGSTEMAQFFRDNPGARAAVDSM